MLVGNKRCKAGTVNCQWNFTRGVASTCAVCGSSSVVVVKLVSAPRQPVYLPSLGRYFKMGTPFLFYCDVLRCYALQVARLGQPVPVHHALSAYPTNQVGYKIVKARWPWDLSLKTTARPRAAPSTSGLFSTINPWLSCYNYYIYHRKL